MDVIRAWLVANPGLIDLLMVLIVWPTLTAFASLFQTKIAEKFPKVWGALQSSGFDLLGLIRRLSGKQKQTETPANAPVVEAKVAVAKVEEAREAVEELPK